MTIKGLIFDFDGTILDTEYPEFTAWQEIYRSFNAELALSEWAKTLGTTNHDFDPMFHLQQRADRHVDTQDVLRYKTNLVQVKIREQSLLPGVQKFLEEAQEKGLQLGIASSSGYGWVHGHLDRFNLVSCFDAIITADDVKNVKPEPDLFILALRELSLDPDEAIVLEDSPSGIKAAHLAGLKCVAIPNRISSQLDLSQADFVVQSLEELTLEELIDKISP